MPTKKKDEKEVKEIALEPIKKTMLRVELIGTSDLILSKKARSYELPEIFKQTHPKGTKIPDHLSQNFNLWEKLITSIHWRDPITYHDDDWSKYTEEEWREYLTNNAPCLHSQAIFGSLYEAFCSFGYKDRTGKNGTDVKRSLTFSKPLFPITFAEAHYEQKLIPNGGVSKTNVVGQYCVFSGWKCNIELATADIAFPTDTVIELISTAGTFCGVSTQRKNGYGRFELGNIEKEGIN